MYRALIDLYGNMQAVLLLSKRGLEEKARVSLLVPVKVKVVGPARPDYGMNEENVVVKDLRKEKKAVRNLILSNL